MDYLPLAETASELITEYGQPVTIRRRVVNILDPVWLVSVDSVALTFTRDSGSWIDDGVTVGAEIVFSGFANAGNNGTFTVSDAAALVLTCSTATVLVDEADVMGVQAVVLADYSASAIENTVSAMSAYTASQQPGSLISESDRFFSVSCTVSPQAGDSLVVGSATLTIQGVRPLAPGGVAIYYDVRARA